MRDLSPEISALMDIFAASSLKRSDNLLLALGSIGKPSPIKEIVERCQLAGLVGTAKWNASDIFSKVPKLARRSGATWQLTTEGKRHVHALGLPSSGSALVQHTDQLLASSIAQISDSTRRDFLHEAQVCFSSNQFRAAVVLSWVGAVWILQEHTMATSLSRFNQAGASRFSNGKYPFKPITTIEDFGRLKEADLLLLLEDIGTIGKSLHKELKNRLDLRNGCGHPNSMIIDPHTVAAHLNFLCMNVYVKF